MRIRPHLTYANVMATLAVFLGIGGTSAYAINEWNGSNIQDGTRGWVSGKEGSHRRLRFANFPGRDVFVNGIEKRKWIRSKSAQKILLILM